MFFKVSLIFLFLFNYPGISHAKNAKNRINTQGFFEVKKISKQKDIKKLDSGFFYRISFIESKKEQKRGFYIDLDHLHPALQKGKIIELSAHSQLNKKSELEASQLLIFVRSTHGKTPVWLLSRNNKKLKLKEASFLKMHKPDFVIL